MVDTDAIKYALGVVLLQQQGFDSSDANEKKKEWVTI